MNERTVFTAVPIGSWSVSQFSLLFFFSNKICQKLWISCGRSSHQQFLVSKRNVFVTCDDVNLISYIGQRLVDICFLVVKYGMTGKTGNASQTFGNRYLFLTLYISCISARNLP
jgi:hypothetical protein